MATDAPTPTGRSADVIVARDRPAGGYGALRGAAVVVLLVLGTRLSLASPPAMWARNLVLKTERYVQTLAPPARDAGVQQEIVTKVDRAVESELDIAGTVRAALPRAAALAGTLERLVFDLVHKVVGDFVASAAFQRLWNGSNRLTHTQLVQLLTGRSPTADLVRVDRVLEHARSLTRWLDHAATRLPVLTFALFAAAVGVAVRRRRALIAAGSCLAAAMVLVGLLLLVARHFYLAALPGVAVPEPVAHQAFDTLVRLLARRHPSGGARGSAGRRRGRGLGSAADRRPPVRSAGFRRGCFTSRQRPGSSPPSATTRAACWRASEPEWRSSS